MRQLVELRWNNELSVLRSSILVDKGEYYIAKFGYPNGYVRQEYINKTLLANPKDGVRESFGNWANQLYLNASTYDKDPVYWQTLVKTWRKPHDVRKWLKFN